MARRQDNSRGAKPARSGQQQNRGAKQARGQQDARRGQSSYSRQDSRGDRGGYTARGARDSRDVRQNGNGGYRRARGSALGLRGGDDISILEGRHAFEEAMETGAAIDAIYISDAIATDDSMMELVFDAKRKGARVQQVDAADLDDYSSHGAHQGIVAQLKPYRYAALADLVRAAEGKENALIIATDHVTDAGNFGAIVRSAEVVGATGVLIPNKRNARVNTAAYKTSAGAVLHLPIAMEANLARSLEALKEEGFWVVGASEHADDIIWDAPLSGRVVLVMGSEGDGLSRIAQDACDLLVKLPQAGKVESLNVAQATTAIAYEWARQCRNA